jgi:hydrogenase maturation protease
LTGKQAVIFGYGNPSRGDDGIGPELMDRAERLLAEVPALAAGLELIQDFQLQIEHALDLQGVGLALFLDASVAAQAPYTFTRLASAQDLSYTTHELSPASVLHVYGQMNLGAAPPSYLLSVRAELFDLGAPIAPAAQANLEAAWQLVEKLCASLEPAAWDAFLTVPTPV